MRHPKGAILFRLKSARRGAGLKRGELLEFNDYSHTLAGAIRVTPVESPERCHMSDDEVYWTLVRKEKLVPVTPLAHQVWAGLPWDGLS